MAVLAAPLVIPFAEALGLSVAILGMDKASDKVNQFIKDNPEESMKIFQMIMPAQGIANALKNKSSEDVEEVQESEIFMNKEKISLEDLDEMTDEEAADLPDEDKAELMKQAGKRRDRELSIATSEKLGLSGPGKEKIDIEREIDERVDPGGIQKEKKGYDFRDYIPKGAYKKRYADGGAIGIEVLFEEKKPRKDFNIGGNVQRVTTPEPYDPRASAADFARAIDRVGAGTDMQKARAVQDYGENVRRQNLLDRVGYTQHMNEDRMLKDANIENQLMNRMGGLNVTQANPAFGLENPFGPGIGMTMLGGAAGAYQGIQSLAGALGLGPKQSLGEMVKDTYENTMGQTILANPEQLEMYNKALNRPTDPVIDQSRISEIVEQQKAAGVPDEGLITNFDPTPTPDAGTIKLPQQGEPGGLITDGGNSYKINEDGMTASLVNQKPTMADVAGPSEVERFKKAYDEAAYGMPSEEVNWTSTERPNYEKMLAQYKNWTGYSGDGSPYFSDPEMGSKFESLFGKSSGYGLKEGGRVGLFMGGSPLDGQALAIYNSMNAYGFSDQEIADALAAQGLYTAGGSTPDTPDTTIQPIGFQSDNGGGGGITELDPLNRPKGTPFDLNSLTKTKFGYNNALGRTIEGVKDFTGSMIDKFSGSKIGEGITSGATKFKNMAFTPMMALMQKRNPLNPNAMNYNPNLQKQMDFLEGTTGTRVFGTSDNLQFEDAAMIGRDPNSGLAKYGPGSVLSGQNVVSGFGTNDYEQQLANYVEKMRTRAITKTLSKFQQQKLEAAMAELGREKARQEKDAADKARAANADVYAELDKITGGKGYGDAGGFSTSRAGKEGAFGTFGEGRGRKDFSEGGLATMFTRKR